MRTERWQQVVERIKTIPEHPVLTSFLVLFGLAIVVFGLSYSYYVEDYYNFVGQVLAEAHGMLFDIAVIGILIYWLNESGQKRMRIRTYLDEIEDFRLWESEEAAFRTAGNIKRLNRYQRYKLDLVNCYLARTNLSHILLKESNLNSANITHSNLIQCNLQNARMNQTNFQGSNLNQANLSRSYASGTIFSNTFLIKANFEGSFLIKANFENALLTEANLRGSVLMGANFKNANLLKADLRGAEGLTVEQLLEAKTLQNALLDEHLLQQVIKRSPQLMAT
ncbi:MAG: pentapeptide repeat-containing protein [Tunicatimonas sp.]|uniref:pentapeptide repeat-containing protein n=1 Tax=Tunicatimonas sp. TaxID=1940096 RepID=UPI003C714438